MSSLPASTIPTRPIERKLRVLRRRLTGWIFLDGAGRLLLVMLLLVAFDLLVDWYFRMDFAQRSIMLVLMAATLLYVLYRALFLPLERRTTDDGLLLEVERTHRDLQQSLISGYQLARETQMQRFGFSPDLVARTIEVGMDRAGAVDFRTALNQQQIRRSMWTFQIGLAGTILLAILVWATPTMSIWFNRNVLLGNEQWPQRTYLEIQGVVDGKLRIDRGTTYELKTIVTESSAVRNVDVEVEFDSDGERSRQDAVPTGRLDGREHLLELLNVNSEFRLRALGGDALTEWVEVELVEPIDLANLRLEVTYPDYIGGGEQLSGSGTHSILIGSQLSVVAEANTPVQTINLNWSAGGVQTIDANGGETSITPLSISMQPQNDRQFATRLSTSDETLRVGTYFIEIRDANGRSNLREISFKVQLVNDVPPTIDAAMSGISGLVVPWARVPVSYTARDRFGLTSAWIAHQWKSRDDTGELFEGVAGERTLTPADAPYSPPEREYIFASQDQLELEPLAIPPGNILRFAVNAADNQPDRSTGTGSSREFLLRVVTEEELRADILRREIEQRTMFRQSRDNQLAALTELRALIAAVRDNPNELIVERERRLLELQNRQSAIGAALKTVADAFSGLMAEAINNRLDERELELQQEIESNTQQFVKLSQRYAEGIIKPIQSLDAVEVFQARLGLDESRELIGKGDPFFETAEQTAQLQETIVQRMDAILVAMEDSQTYQEIVNQVIAIKRLEQDLINAIQQKKQGQTPPSIFD